MGQTALNRVRGMIGALWRGVLAHLQTAQRAAPTGRGALIAAIGDILSVHWRLRQAAAVMVFEVDDFRKLEEAFDRDTINVILEDVTCKTRDLLDLDDRIVPLEGARFGIALSSRRRLDLESAIQLATRIQHAMADPVLIDARQIHVTVSVGFVLASRLDQPDAEQLLRAASIAQFEACKGGPNAIRSYSAAMYSRITSHNGLITQVQTALQNKEITAHYQPQIDLVSGELSGG